MAEAISIIIASVVVPYLVALIRNNSVSSGAARWLALGVSLLAGIAAGLMCGIPSTPQAWVACIFATIGGVQVAYTAFKSVGVTCKWLDALQDIGNTPKVGGTDE